MCVCVLQSFGHHLDAIEYMIVLICMSICTSLTENWLALDSVRRGRTAVDGPPWTVRRGRIPVDGPRREIVPAPQHLSILQRLSVSQCVIQIQVLQSLVHPHMHDTGLRLPH